jgi:hypothetical protein
MRNWVSLVGAVLLGTSTQYSASAAEEHAFCVVDWVGCVADYRITCEELGQGTPTPTMVLVRQKATGICRGIGYTGETIVRQLPPLNAPGGQCGQYKYIFTCQ